MVYAQAARPFRRVFGKSFAYFPPIRRASNITSKQIRGSSGSSTRASWNLRDDRAQQVDALPVLGMPTSSLLSWVRKT
jgi:hypothetical protein